MGKSHTLCVLFNKKFVSNSKILFFHPLVAAYIKVYLLENGVCVAKKKTKRVRKSLDPLYNQVLVFTESPQGKVVQVKKILYSPHMSSKETCSMYLVCTVHYRISGLDTFYLQMFPPFAKIQH